MSFFPVYPQVVFARLWTKVGMVVCFLSTDRLLLAADILLVCIRPSRPRRVLRSSLTVMQLQALPSRSSSGGL